jgi:hypothetical protein
VSPPPAPTADLAAAAAAAGAEIQTGGDFMEISFPPPAGIPAPSAAMSPTPAGVARTPATAEPGIFRDSAAAPRQLGGGATLARAAVGSSSGGGGSAGDHVVDAVLRAMREENEHLGILDGIDPLY